jgi:hypothetical protein
MGRSPRVLRALQLGALGTSACVALLAGCGDGEHDAKTPGEPIGRFAMTGALERDECQAPVLGVIDPWKFEMRLSRLGNDLYWLNGREAIAGSLSANEDFDFDTRVDTVIEPPRSGRPGCTLSRRDIAQGSLTPNADAASEIEAEITFVYDVSPGSDCRGVVGVPGGFARLPCRVDFGLTGTRLDPPSE